MSLVPYIGTQNTKYATNLNKFKFIKVAQQHILGVQWAMLYIV